MDLKLAINFAQLVNAAYAISPTDLTNRQGQTITVNGTDYVVVTSVYANDLATDINALRAQ